MMTFDRALPELVATCEADAAFTSGAGATPAVERACAVRDPHGRVRLVLGLGRALTDTEVNTLKQRMEAALLSRLEGFFVGPVLTTRDPDASGKIAHALLEKSEDWKDAAYEDAVRGGIARPLPGRWTILERRLTKQGWLDPQEPPEPWPLSAGRPVITFYSFKGGVGRTTLLVSCALQLAEQGKRVAVIDLDLEAPGLGPLLGVDTERGVLDAIVERVAMPAEGEPKDLSTDGRAVLEELVRLGVIAIRSDGRVDVPDIYRFGFGIKRKGGVARPR